MSYLSQFVGPPPNILRAEQKLYATILRFPFCACPRAVPHYGNRIRLARVPPVEEYCRAAAIRAAARHKPLLLKCVTKLQHIRDEYADITYSTDMMKPDVGWMSAALALDDLPVKTRDIINSAENGYLSQAKVLEPLIESRSPASLEEVLSARVISLMEKLQQAGMARADEPHAATRSMLTELRRHSPIYAWLLLRTWTTSWPTSQRTQQGIVGCILACPPPAIDSMPHALFCPMACKALARARGVPFRCDPWSIGLGSQMPGRTSLNMSFAAMLTHVYLKGQVSPCRSFREGLRQANILAPSAVRHIGRLR